MISGDTRDLLLSRDGRSAAKPESWIDILDQNWDNMPTLQQSRRPERGRDTPMI